MVEGDNTSGETDKDGDIYHNYRVNYVYITFDGAEILAGSPTRPPTHSSWVRLFLSGIPLPSPAPPSTSHTPFSQYVAHSCFCLKTVLLINWWVCACNKNHDSRWTIHLLLPNSSNGTGCSLGSRCKAPYTTGTGQRMNQSVASLRLWLWFTDAMLWWHLSSAASHCALIWWGRLFKK